MAQSFINRRRSADWNYGGKNWKLSRSKIDLFTECRRCFYLDNVMGVTRPKMPSFTLNIAVDHLLKKEFDLHRVKKTAHPLMEQYGVNAVPFIHKDIELWRDNFQGVQHYYEPAGFIVSGAIDDAWVNPEGEVIVVDYKATSKDGKMDSLDDTKWQNQYRRQMEVYQWLLRQKGFTVSDTGYFVYVNGKKDTKAFDGKLEFDVTLIAHIGKTDWIEPILAEIKTCLDSELLPASSPTCEHCAYIQKYREALQEKSPVLKTAKESLVSKKTEEPVSDIKKSTAKKKKSESIPQEKGLFG